MQTKVIHSSVEPTFNVFGPLHQFLVDPSDTSGVFGLMQPVVPSGIAIPLHQAPAPASQEDIQRLLALAAKYNYWIGSPEENEAWTHRILADGV
jgi:hypothetical protein